MNLDHLVSVSRAAYRMDRTGYLSSGEGLAAAVVLNRHDWLKARGYTIIEALERVGARRDDLVAAEQQIKAEIDSGELQRATDAEGA